MKRPQPPWTGAAFAVAVSLTPILIQPYIVDTGTLQTVNNTQCAASLGSKCRIHCFDSLMLHVRQDVRIDTQCNRNVGMAKHLGDNLHIDSWPK